MGTPLQEYNAKRDFKKTSEPAGTRKPAKAKAEGGIFVVHKHAARRLHYDLRLEHDGVLWSWAVTRGPSLDPAEKRLAVHVEDHPFDYRTFEGMIPKGEYGGGAVIIWDQGTWEPEFDPDFGMEKGHIRFTLKGGRLKGEWHLVRLKPRPGDRTENWLFFKSDDEFASRGEDILVEHTTSVVSGRTIEDVEQGKAATKAAKAKSAARAPAKRGGKGPAKAGAPMPGFIEPSLASLASKTPGGAEWLHEIKFDGYRMQAHLADGKVTLFTRSGLDWTEKFGRPIIDTVAALPCGQAIIDGEIVALTDAGISSFSALQQALSEGRRDKMVFYVFDLLHLDGDDLQSEPLAERKARLAELLANLPPDGPLRYSEHFEVKGESMFDQACRMGLEGVVSKRADAPYRSGRARDWIKTKCIRRNEFVIAGYIPSDKTGRGLRSLLVGVFENGKLTPMGRVGTGFTAAGGNELKKRLDAIKARKSAFSGPAAKEKGVVWVEPELVAEVEYRDITHDGQLRHASFQGLREDKPAHEVVEEKPLDEAAEPDGGANGKAGPAGKRKPAKAAPARPETSVSLSNPGKLLWPEAGVTKQGLLDHYAMVWPRIRPFLVDRPLSLVRAPEGIGGQRFFQKHSMPGMHASILKSHDPEDNEEVLYIRDFDGLAALVQLGVVEIHIWGSSMADIGRPDQIVFDLDPDEGLDVEAVRAASFEVKQRLEELGFATFVKTSGGKGFHVVVPLKPAAGWDEVKTFAHDFAEAMRQNAPDRYTATLSKKARHGRIFLDYLRNGRGATAIAPYSARAKPAATVAVPITWEELERGVKPDDFRIGETVVEAMARPDPWEGFFKAARPLRRK